MEMILAKVFFNHHVQVAVTSQGIGYQPANYINSSNSFINQFELNNNEDVKQQQKIYTCRKCVKTVIKI